MLDVSSENLLRSVFHTLAYADIFDYPLTTAEVYRYLTSVQASRGEVVALLQDKSFFAQVDEFFTLRGREHIVETRKRRAEIAARLWPKAVRYGEMIAGLPYVRMVAVTGSLAMNNTDEGKDVDYMIVTAPNRLWTCRAFILLLARVAKLDYLVTTNALELRERSLYVAHELAQMILIYGMKTYREIRRLNLWIHDYLPNALMESDVPQDGLREERNSFIQKPLEIISGLPFVNWLEEWEMNRKIARLTREQSSSFESYFSADVCKGHVDRHGENVVTALAVRLRNVTGVVTTKTI
jgi:hypothetical protein